MTGILIECILNPKKAFKSLCNETIYTFQMSPILKLFLQIHFLCLQLIPTMRIILFQRILLSREIPYFSQFNNFFFLGWDLLNERAEYRMYKVRLLTSLAL